MKKVQFFLVVPSRAYTKVESLLCLINSMVAAEQKPNVVVFLVDDLDYMDIGANNPNCFSETPKIDAFAKSAIRFTDGYAANSVCSPTRYSLLTGKYPTRSGATIFSPALKGESLEPRSLYWHYPHYSNQGGIPSGAIREGNFKLVERNEDSRVHLYNLKDDIGEQNVLATQSPERVEQMRARLHAWYKSVDAKFLKKRKKVRSPGSLKMT